MFGQARVPFGQRYRTSRQIFAEAWTLMRGERDLWRFPVASGLVFVVAMTAILVPFQSLVLGRDWSVSPQVVGLVAIPVLLVLFLPVGFLVALLNSAYAFGLHERLAGRDTSAAAAWARARAHAGPIFRFTLIGALVGGVLAVVGQVLDKLRLVPYLGSILQVVGAYAWAVAAFFVIPIIVVEREASASEAVRRSVALARTTWGRSTAGIVTINLAVMVPMGILLGLFMLLVFGSIASEATGVGPGVLWPVLVAATALMLVGLCALMVVSQAANLAYQVALYQTQRTGHVPLPFTPDTLVDAWAPYRK